MAGWRIDHRVLTLPPGAEPPEWKLLQWAVEQGCALVGDSQVLRAAAMGRGAAVGCAISRLAASTCL